MLPASSPKKRFISSVILPCASYHFTCDAFLLAGALYLSNNITHDRHMSWKSCCQAYEAMMVIVKYTRLLLWHHRLRQGHEQLMAYAGCGQLALCCSMSTACPVLVNNLVESTLICPDGIVLCTTICCCTIYSRLLLPSLQPVSSLA